jgi:hypothetical protein
MSISTRIGYFSALVILTACGGTDASPLHASLEAADDAHWIELAERNGFPVDVGDNFFGFAQQGCTFDLFNPPTTLQELGERSQRAMFGRIVDVTARFREGAIAPETYDVFLVLEVLRSVKGEVSGTVEVPESCSPAGKVAGLRRARPDDTYLFFMLDPLADDMITPEGVYFLSWYVYGVVQEGDDGPSFAYDSPMTDGWLSGYDSLEQVAATVAP